MNVVFTGPAFDSQGNSIVRSELSYACLLRGIAVQASVRGDTQMVVASRCDTVKAKNASIRGLKVMTYPEFIDSFLEGMEIKKGGLANKWVDFLSDEQIAPKTGSKTLVELDVL